MKNNTPWIPGLAVADEDLPAGYTPELVNQYFAQLDSDRPLNADEFEAFTRDKFRMGDEVELTDVKSGESVTGRIIELDSVNSQARVECVQVEKSAGAIRRKIFHVFLPFLASHNKH